MKKGMAGGECGEEPLRPPAGISAGLLGKAVRGPQESTGPVGRGQKTRQVGLSFPPSCYVSVLLYHVHSPRSLSISTPSVTRWLEFIEMTGLIFSG